MNGSVRRADVAVIGAGAAGLSAALVLGRARRSVIAFDDGTQRNTVAERMHGFIAHDGLKPAEFLRMGRAELQRYSGVSLVAARVASVHRDGGGFQIDVAGGSRYSARRVLLATGLTDVLPAIDGLDQFWGRSVFVCPYCDGWEVRDRRLLICGDVSAVVGLAQELYQWSPRIVVANAPPSPAPQEAAWIAASGIRVTPQAVRSVSGSNGELVSARLEGGETVDCDAVFLAARLHQHSGVAVDLGCELTPDDHIKIDERNRTSISGVYAAGDATTKHHQVVIAAASGVAAAIHVNDDLTCEDAAALARGVPAG